MQPLSPPLFSLLSALVEERTGIHYDVSDIVLFSDKMASRVSEAGFENALDYYYFLRYDPAGEKELVHLIDLLVVGETYLFRELDALTAAIEQVIEPAVRKRGRARVWSAGCSTGEEPFTIAMMLAEAQLLASVDLVATDLSAKSVARAHSGVVANRALRALARDRPFPAPDWVHRIAEKWVTPTPDGGAQIASTILHAINFRRGSILEPARGSPFEDLDLILCRNVLIYFQDNVVRLAVSKLSERLRSDGKLLVGTAESLLRFGTMLRCEERGGTFFYTKEERDRMTPR